MTARSIFLDRLASAWGDLLLAHDDERLCALEFQDYTPRLQQHLQRHYAVPQPKPLPAAIAQALQAYLAGVITALDSIPVQAWGTPFQQTVWQTLRRIPAGQTWTYAELARAIGQPTAIRAVAAANARNPVALVIPCHRVIGSDGGLTGYAGGLARKHALLVHEGARDAADPENPSRKQRLHKHSLPLLDL